MMIELKILLVICVAAAAENRQQNLANANTNPYGLRADFGFFNFNVKTIDGLLHHASGELKNFGTVRGQYTYNTPDGVQYRIEYTVDVNRVQPFGTQFPQIGAPPGGGFGGGCTEATLCGTGLG